MVKKLFKHEFKALFRYMLPVECIILALFIFARVIFFFETDNIVYDVTQFSVIMMLIAAFVAGNIAILIFAIIRYYKNLFTLEGYLSFTLPVTPAQHIMVKVVTAVVFDIVALLIAVLGLCIAMSGNLLVEVFNLIVYTVKNIIREVGAIHVILYLFEIVIACIAASFSKFLLYYGFITIGQMASRRKLLLAFGAYGIYSLISGVFSTVLNIFGNIFFWTDSHMSEVFFRFINNHPYGSIHIAMITVIVSTIVGNLIWFAVCNLIIHKKLNLE